MTIEELSMMIFFMNIGLALYIFGVWYFINSKLSEVLKLLEGKK